MFNRIKKIFNPGNNLIAKTLPQLELINKFKSEFRDKPFDEFKTRISEMKSELSVLVSKIPNEARDSLKRIDRTSKLPDYELAIQKKLYEFMPEVYAMVNEVYRRKLGFEYHNVQLQAAIILAEGQRLVELYTGEGKTMTFQLPLFLYSLAGRGSHLVTVNDYLSRRDGEYAGHIASELGLSVGIVTSQGNYKFVSDSELKNIKGEEVSIKRDEMKLQINNLDGINLVESLKRESYLCDITYGTNNEFGFDYLRDNMVFDIDAISQRELYFCIIDEADSILIDESRTPLIISGIPSEANVEKYSLFASSVKGLTENEDYTVDHKSRSVVLTENGIKNVENRLGIDNLWNDYSAAFHIENALKAEVLYKNDQEYLVRNGEVLIVDEFTGRILKGRRYSEGLHQAIEAKEGVDIKQESKTFATITFQNFFRLYKVLAGGSGTIMTEAEEFFKIYGLESIPIPTNKPVIRLDSPDLIYKNQDSKFRAVIKDVKERHEKGQPVLIGTASVEKSELLSNLLDKERISHEVLNAKYHEQEAKIVAEAGKKGAVTVATNMAGRGADIVIGGGTRGDKDWEEIASLGGLHVIGTERHEARRIDNQLRGRTGRQGEPGSSRFYVALDDQLMRILGGDMMQRVLGMVGLEEDTPIQLTFISRQIESAQKRVESLNFDNRKRVVDYDDVMNKHREIFYSRRRNILRSTDEASGKFVIDGKVKNLKDFKDDESLKLKQEESLKSLITYTKNIYLESLRFKIEKFFLNNSKVDNKNIDEFVKSIANFLPGIQLAKVLNVSNIDISKTLNENLISLKVEDKIGEYILNTASKVYDLKVSEYSNDFPSIVKSVGIQELDNAWVDHLELMKDIRDGIGLQSYAQKDPLVEYRNEAFSVFNSFISKLNDTLSSKILNLQKVRVNNSQKIDVGSLKTNTDQIDDVNTGSREFISGDSMLQQTLKKQLGSNGLKKMVTNSPVEAGKKLNASKKDYGRNDKVSVRYTDGKELKDVKYKKVENDILNGNAVII